MKRLSTYFALGATAWLFCCGNHDPHAEREERAHQALRDASASTRTDVVAVLSRVNGTDAWCTGVVLEPTLVLTAQHCVAAAAPPNTTFDCATATLTPVSPQSQVWVTQDASVTEMNSPFVSVSSVRLPAGASRLCGDDIALLELSEPLADATFAGLTVDVPPAHSGFTSVGYGTDGTLSGVQRENSASAITCIGSDCADSRIAESELLATSGACEGDSGGPAFASEGSVFAIAVRSRADCEQTAYLGLAQHGAWLAQNAADVAKQKDIAVPTWAVTILASLEQHPMDAADASVTPLQPERVLLAYGGGCSVPTRAPQSNLATTLVFAVCLLITLRRIKPR